MFEETFIKEITLHTRTVLDARGDATYQDAPIMARVEPSVRVLLNQKGEEFTSSSLVMTKAQVQPGDKLTIDGITRVVELVSSASSLFGEHTHYECYV